MGSKNVTLRLDENLLEEWKGLARKKGVSLSQWLTDRISNALFERDQLEAERMGGGKPDERHSRHRPNK